MTPAAKYEETRSEMAVVINLWEFTCHVKDLNFTISDFSMFILHGQINFELIL